MTKLRADELERYHDQGWIVPDYRVPEALLRLTEAYQALGLTNESRRMAAILGHNYPGSAWYADAYELVEGVELV